MRLPAIVLFLYVTGALTVPAVESGASARPENPLAALPSKPGAHVEKLRAMADDSWLELGAPAPDPKWGRARGRAWGSKMAYAPDLGGAFFCGEGPHAKVKPDGHYMDDLWFYDAGSHRWICLYPGADVKNLKLKLDANGFEVDAEGRFVPVAYLGHAYNLVTYDTDLRKYMIIALPGSWWAKALPGRGEWLGVPEADRGKPYHNGKLNCAVKHPIFFDVAAGRWERRFVEGAGPGRRFEGVAEYIPSRKQTLCLLREGMWFYDNAANKWTGPQKSPANGYDSNACLDTKRNRLLVAKQKEFWAYDLAGAVWKRVEAENQPENLGCTNDATLTYDAAADAAVWLGIGTGPAIYDPQKNAWRAGAPMPKRDRNLHGFYDAALNVHFIYVARDGNDKGTMWAYRHRRSAAPEDKP